MRTGPYRPLQLLAYFRRIDALERALGQAQRLLYQDDLTPLLNRRGLRRTCDHWSASGEVSPQTCCVMLDLDDFKSINDQHGHPVGDAALLHFSKTLLQHLRQADALARLGGDEFALVLTNTMATDARQVLEHLQRVLAASPIAIVDKFVRLRFSAGIAERKAGEPLSDALARADTALIDAKRSGKSTVRLHAPLPHCGYQPQCTV